MVIYDLVCEFGHEFEGWFRNSEELASQQEKKMLTCPCCGTEAVSKKMTASKVSKKSNSDTKLERQRSNHSYLNNQHISSDFELPNRTDADMKMSKDQYIEYKKVLSKVHKYVENNFEDVGNRFAKEALSIHRGDVEAKNIRGTASKEQMKKLSEEGVSTAILPSKLAEKKDLN